MNEVIKESLRRCSNLSMNRVYSIICFPRDTASGASVPGLGNRTFALSLITHFRSFQKSDFAIVLFCHFFQKTIVQSLFRKERMSKNVQKIVNFRIALFRYLKREQPHIFKKCDCPTLRFTTRIPGSDGSFA